MWETFYFLCFGSQSRHTVCVWRGNLSTFVKALVMFLAIIIAFSVFTGQWGMPTVTVSSFMAMLAATLTSIIESVGDYYACARISLVTPPPAHAVNRGILMEGIGSILSGIIGSGGATTSYSQNVGAIGFTKVNHFKKFRILNLKKDVLKADFHIINTLFSNSVIV